MSEIVYVIEYMVMKAKADEYAAKQLIDGEIDDYEIDGSQ